MAPAVKAAYLGYLGSLTSRFPNVRLIGGDIPGWPSAMFTDDVHLNPAGAERFTARLGACIQGGSIRADCDLDWDAHLSRAESGTEVR